MKYRLLLFLFLAIGTYSFAQNHHSGEKQNNKPAYRFEYRPTNRVENQFDTIFEVYVIVDEAQIESIKNIKVKGKSGWGEHEKYVEEINQDRIKKAPGHKSGKGELNKNPNAKGKTEREIKIGEYNIAGEQLIFTIEE